MLRNGSSGSEPDFTEFFRGLKAGDKIITAVYVPGYRKLRRISGKVLEVEKKSILIKNAKNMLVRMMWSGNVYIIEGNTLKAQEHVKILGIQCETITKLKKLMNDEK